MTILSFFSVFLGHFCPSGSGSGSAICMRIRIQKLKLMRIRIRNPGCTNAHVFAVRRHFSRLFCYTSMSFFSKLLWFRNLGTRVYQITVKFFIIFPCFFSPQIPSRQIFRCVNQPITDFSFWSRQRGCKTIFKNSDRFLPKAPKFGHRLVQSNFLFVDKEFRASIFARRKIMYKCAYLRFVELICEPPTFDQYKLNESLSPLQSRLHRACWALKGQ